MLQLTIVLSDEGWSDEEEKFLPQETYILELEHSLVALSKWESKYKKAFLGPIEKTQEEVLGYVEAMNLNPFTPPEIFEKLTKVHFDQINEYIEDKMTATTFNEPRGQARSREIISSELIYYWMTSYQIPWEAETWHLNRLFALIKIFNIKNSKPRKMSRNEAAAQRRQLNEQRRAQHGTTG